MQSLKGSIPAACLLFLGLASAAWADGAANSTLSARHRLLLLAARDLASSVAERVWPGWSAEMEVLLVADEQEVLLGGSRVPAGFESVADDPELGALAVRPRIFPTSLLATMPVFGPPATIVVGGPETTERGSSEWLRVLLHEHFHQWQMRRPEYFSATTDLALADGDTSGRWMLEYPFPYDASDLGTSFGELGRELVGLLERPAGDDLGAEAAEFWAGFERLEGLLETRDARYLNFQLWQEGVARYVELRVAEEAAYWSPPVALLALPDFAGFGARSMRASLLAELADLDLAGDRRVAFYALGAGMALLLDRTEADWKSRFEAPRFALAPSAPGDRVPSGG